MAFLMFSGSPGTGKTWVLVSWATIFLQNGYRVASNAEFIPPEGTRIVDLRHTGPEGNRQPDMTIAAANETQGPVLFLFDGWKDIIGLTECQVFKDEAQADTGARDWESLGIRDRLWMSMHRHYRTNVFLFTQHLKFVDIYPRRLAVGSVYSMAKFLNLTLVMPCPDADMETTEFGTPDFLGTTIVVRPWKSIDFPVWFPGTRELWKVRRTVAAAYATHKPKDRSESTKKPRSPPTGAAADPLRGSSAAAPTQEIPFL